MAAIRKVKLTMVLLVCDLVSAALALAGIGWYGGVHAMLSPTSYLLDCSIVPSPLLGFVFGPSWPNFSSWLTLLPCMSASGHTVSALHCRIARGHCPPGSANSCPPVLSAAASWFMSTGSSKFLKCQIFGNK
jgi:hypothetical protein